MIHLLDIVIPVYNEGKNIVSVLNGIHEVVRTPHRVLICYDFPEDDTLVVLTPELRSKFNVELILNEGKGAHAAIMTGFKHSITDAVLVFPADDITNAGIIDLLFQHFKMGSEI